MQRHMAKGHEAHQEQSIAVDVLGLATAVPANTISQDEAVARAKKYYPQFARLEGLFSNTGISNRYTVEPSEWYEQEHTWEERTASFEHNALDLLEDIARRSTAAAGVELSDIDVVITNTITGLSIPSLEARLMNRLDFRSNVQRLPIFGLGCGGGVAGLARAERMARCHADETVLFMTVDLCSLCMRVNDPSLAMFVSSALFGDGAVGVVLNSRNVEGTDDQQGSLGRIVATGEYFWSNTEHIMGWDVKNDGFGVVLSPELPTLMRDRLGEALSDFLNTNGLALQDFDGFLFHPGGSKVLETAQAVLDLDPADLQFSWDVLRDYGNMSSATALFVLKHAIDSGARGRHLMAAFGPGFSAYFVVLDL
ncbi:MAG: type III polyketide synthase [Hyphomicrobiaceae bacterium]